MASPWFAIMEAAVRGFKHKGLARFYEKEAAGGIPHQHRKRILGILRALDGNTPLKALEMLPGFRPHPLKGNRKGQWAVRLTGNRRIVFRIEDNEVYDIDLIDYH